MATAAAVLLGAAVARRRTPSLVVASATGTAAGLLRTTARWRLLLHQSPPSSSSSNQRFLACYYCCRCSSRVKSPLLALSSLPPSSPGAAVVAVRFFSGDNDSGTGPGSGGGSTGGGRKKGDIDDPLLGRMPKGQGFLKDGDDDDPFGVNYRDGETKLGPTENLPPVYKRDTMTGRQTYEIEKELSESDRRILHADPIELDRLLARRFEERLRHDTNKDKKKSKKTSLSGVAEENEEGTTDRSDDDSDDKVLQDELNRMGRRVRRSDMGLNVLGRSVKAQSSTETLDDGSEMGRDGQTGFTQRLTPSEFDVFTEYMKKKHHVHVTEDDIPVQARRDRNNKKRTATAATAAGSPGQEEDEDDDDEEDDPDEKKLAMKWLTARGVRQMSDYLDDNPYSDLMPYDLSPSRLVNRKRAKQLPVSVLHHNNVELLRQFTTPTGQIMNRIQSRLGARDQRRVAKLVKRARALGIIPYSGQFKAERHGWIHERDIRENRSWEEELIRRGLVIKRGRDHRGRESEGSSNNESQVGSGEK